MLLEHLVIAALCLWDIIAWRHKQYEAEYSICNVGNIRVGRCVFTMARWSQRPREHLLVTQIVRNAIGPILDSSVNRGSESISKYFPQGSNRK